MKTIIKMILILSFTVFTTSGINNNIEEIIRDDRIVLAQGQPIQKEIVYDGLTMEELAAKLDRNLNSTISGYGYVFASKSVELGLDPYLAVAIMLHETGCKWTCSSLMQKCNNVGGMKGSPGCNGGSYKRFDTLDEGIDAFLNLLYNKYYSKGYKTPEQIGPIYAADSSWPIKVNKYIEAIKNS